MIGRYDTKSRRGKQPRHHPAVHGGNDDVGAADDDPGHVLRHTLHIGGGAHTEAQRPAELGCRADRLAFPIRDGIPVMLESEARAWEFDAEAPTP